MRARVNPDRVKLLKLFFELAFPAPHDGRQYHHALAFRQVRELLDDLVDALARDGAPALVTVGLAYGREEQPQVIINLRNRPYGRARAAHSRLLLDRDGGRQPVYRVHVGLFELVEELPRVGRERLDVAALPFGINGVEGEDSICPSRKGP